MFGLHELSVTESILRIALDEAKKNNAGKVINIKIKSGVLSGIMPQLIQDYFNLVSTGTIAEGAELIIDRIAASIRCRDCDKVSPIERLKLVCPICGGTNTLIETGKEFYIDSMEVE